MSFESKPSTQVVKRCAFISIFVRSLAQLTHLGKSRKVFPKTGRWHSDIPEAFSRLFSDFIISGHEAGDFLETISRSISWVLTRGYPWKKIFSQNRVMTRVILASNVILTSIRPKGSKLQSQCRIFRLLSWAWIPDFVSKSKAYMHVNYFIRRFFYV